MKNFKYIIFGFLVFILGTGFTHAASLSVSANKSTVVVGSTVTVTVNASGAAGWEYCLNYDSSIFSLTSANSDTGGKCVKTGSTMLGGSKVTFTLKAIKSGSSTISLTDAIMYGEDGVSIASNKNSLNLVTKTQAEIEASYSTNANLKSLEIEGFSLTPTFHKDTLSYTLEVENDVEKVVVSASLEDRAASIRGTGEIDLLEGPNKVEIVVTAQKGNKKTYVVTITRKELNPIFVQIGGDNLTVVRKSDALEAPLYYTSATTIIEDIEVPAFVNDITGFTLVGLKNEDGDISLYRVDSGNYVLYQQVNLEGVVFVPLEVPSLLSDYPFVKTLEINGEKVNGYYKEGMDENFVLVYGMNVRTGEKNWYQYDLVEGSLQRFENKEIVKLKEDLKDYFLLIILFASGLCLSIVSLLILLIMNSKTRKTNKKMLSMLENKLSLEKEKQETNLSEKKGKTKKKERKQEDEKDEKLGKEEVSTAKETSSLSETSLGKRELRKIEKEKEKEKEKQEELKSLQDAFYEEDSSRKSLVEVLEEKKQKDK